MSTALKWQMARQLYGAGSSLLQEGHYEQAIVELRRAEEAFRRLDARGHPFGYTLPNGISGLANTLSAEGLCFQKLGDFASAITCYETSLVNAKFEKSKPFRTFLKQLYENLAACYEKELGRLDAQALDALLIQDPAIDPSFRFPFSLDTERMRLAKLYELAPRRYQHFKSFYQRARKKDVELRRLDSKSDDVTMKKMSVTVWGILSILWVIYGVMVVKALFHA